MYFMDVLDDSSRGLPSCGGRRAPEGPWPGTGRGGRWGAGLAGPLPLRARGRRDHGLSRLRRTKRGSGKNLSLLRTVTSPDTGGGRTSY